MTSRTSSDQPSDQDHDALPTVNVLGIPVTSIRLPELLEYVRRAITSPDRHSRPRLIAYANANSCNLFLENEEYHRSLLAADLIYSDGNGPRFAAWLSGAWLPPRMTGADWLEDLCQLCERDGFRLYFIGALPGVAKAAATKLRLKYRELLIVGVHDGYFGPGQESAAIQAVNLARPDILVLGMGSPYQESWMTKQKPVLNVPVVWGAGGVFDYASGRIPRPPWWMRKLALEWLGRMMIEPRRLAPRYLIGIPVFVARSIRHAYARRRQRLIR